MCEHIFSFPNILVMETLNETQSFQLCFAQRFPQAWAFTGVPTG